jgi:hypothetical protein
VTRKHRRASRRRSFAYAVAAIAASVALVVLVPRAIDLVRSQSAVPPAGGRGEIGANLVPTRLAGTYSKVIADRPGLIRTYSLAGRWTMEITRTGDLRISVPAGFDVIGVPPPASVTVDGARLTTNALFHGAFGCGTEGVYQWSSKGSRLLFHEINDDCLYRPIVFTTGAWARSD